MDEWSRIYDSDQDYDYQIVAISSRRSHISLTIADYHVQAR